MISKFLANVVNFPSDMSELPSITTTEQGVRAIASRRAVDMFWK